MSRTAGRTLGRREFVRLFPAAAAVVGVASITGCTSSAGQSSGGTSAVGRLRISSSDGSTNDLLDPLRVERSMQGMCAGMMFESLIDIDEQMQPVGRLAESFETPDDGVTWDFKLRDGVRMHDGSSLGPADVIFCIGRALDPAVSSGNALAGQLKGILRPQGITALDDRTVRFALDKKTVFFPQLMAARNSRIYKAGTTDFTRPIGTGPFVFESFKPGRYFSASRFDDYWDGPPGVEHIEVNNYPEESTRLSAFLDGDDDLMFYIEPSSASSVLATKGSSLIQLADSVWIPLALDTTVAPFNNPAVVQAMKLAVDREQVVKNALGGYGSVGYDMPIPSADDSFAGLPRPTYDPDAARDLLAKAGYANGVTLPTLDVLDLPVVLGMALVLQQQLKDVGINFEINRVPTATFWTDSWLKKPFYTNTYSRRSTNDETLRLCFYSTGKWNMSKRADPEIDQAIDAAANTTDVEEQKKQYAIVQRLIAERDSTIISAHTSRLHGLSAAVSGVTPNLVSHLDFRKAGITK